MHYNTMVNKKTITVNEYGHIGSITALYLYTEEDFIMSR